MTPRAFITVDVETEGLNPYRDKLVFIGYRLNGIGDVTWVHVDKGETDAKLKALLIDESIVKRGHNIKFDALFLSCNGYPVRGVLDDTRILAYLSNPFRSLDLESLARTDLQKVHLNFQAIYVRDKQRDPNKEYVKIDKKYVLRTELIKKNYEDINLCDGLRSNSYSTAWYRDVEQPLIKTIYNMEHRGIRLDIDYLKNLNLEYVDKLSRLEKSINLTNPRSSQQVEQKLFDLGLSLKNFSVKGKNGHYSTDKLTLKRLAWSTKDPGRAIADILEYRKLNKLRNTYVEPLIRDSDNTERIHGSFNQAGKITRDDSGSGTATGRLSSSGPNLQNIPARTEEGRRIRAAFIPSKGMKLFCSDLKQIEPRVLAHFTQAPKLIRAYNNDWDTHKMIGADIFKKNMNTLTKLERFIGKTCWLATVYGCGPKKLKFIVERDSDDPVLYDEQFYRSVQDNFWGANPEIAAWRRYHIESVRKSGSITTYGGRIIEIPNINSRNQYGQDGRFAAERKAVNYLIQGSAADIMKLIMLEFNKRCPQIKLLAVVHDEILAEIDEVVSDSLIRSTVEAIMTNTCKLNNVPIGADTKIAANWGLAK